MFLHTLQYSTILPFLEGFNQFMFNQFQTVVKSELIWISGRGKWDPTCIVYIYSKINKQNNRAKRKPRIQIKI